MESEKKKLAASRTTVPFYTKEERKELKGEYWEEDLKEEDGINMEEFNLRSRWIILTNHQIL